MTVDDLRKKLRGIKGDIPVYLADHDHSLYETNGPASSIYVLNQKDMEYWNEVDEEFKIDGEYLVIRI